MVYSNSAGLARDRPGPQLSNRTTRRVESGGSTGGSGNETFLRISQELKYRFRVPQRSDIAS